MSLISKPRSQSRMKKHSAMAVWQSLLLVQCCIICAVMVYTGSIHIHFSPDGLGFQHAASAQSGDLTTRPREEVQTNNLVSEEEPMENGEAEVDHQSAPTRPSDVISRHPCEGFSRPPPPSRSSKRTGPRRCDVCYVSVDEAVASMPTVPAESPVLENLTYYYSKSPIQKTVLANGEKLIGSDFGGYHSVLLRNISFNIQQSMIVPCGFVPGKRPGRNTGFDINFGDLLEMEECRGLVVVSAIFANFDLLHQPRNISAMSKKNVCFYMFVDVQTEGFLKKTGQLQKKAKKIGLWRLVVVQNLPFEDPRRNGKIPKLLIHRLFPNARYSIWIDGKLELVVDPYQILERFLWREKASFAISRHYARFDVFVEAEHNKAAGKYDNASIDEQIDFYRKEGLTHFSPAKHPITSDVPEGCVIIREHTPISNLFACLWFNEVDRFTSRDQLSFSTVRDKIFSKVGWTVNMFEDCERRNFVVQSYHRDLLEKKNSSTSNRLPSSRTVPRESTNKQKLPSSPMVPRESNGTQTRPSSRATGTQRLPSSPTVPRASSGTQKHPSSRTVAKESTGMQKLPSSRTASKESTDMQKLPPSRTASRESTGARKHIASRTTRQGKDAKFSKRARDTEHPSTKNS